MKDLLNSTNISSIKPVSLTFTPNKKQKKWRKSLLEKLMILSTTFLLLTTGSDAGGKIYWNLSQEQPRVAWYSSNPNAEIPDIIKALVPFGLSTVVLTKASTSPWSVPMDWNRLNNRIVCIGAGAGINVNNSSSQGYGGCGGGACVFINNYNGIVPGTSVSFSVGTGSNFSTEGNATGSTWLVNTSTFYARCGGSGAGGTTGGSGGSGPSSVVPTGGTKFSGGNGGATSSVSAGGAGGGGGAAGTTGNGGNGGIVNISGANAGGGGGGASNGVAGGACVSTTQGGNGGNSGPGGAGTGGAGGTNSVEPNPGVLGGGGGGGGFVADGFGATGGAGHDLDGSSFGSGGAGGGQGWWTSGESGGNGGNYGGGAGGQAGQLASGNGRSGTARTNTGGDGLIFMTYVPIFTAYSTVTWFG